MIRREGTERLSSEGAMGSRPYTGISVRVGRTFSEPRRESTTQGLEKGRFLQLGDRRGKRGGERKGGGEGGEGR